MKTTLIGKESLVGLTDDPNITQLTIISEAGLYKLIFRSRKPEAEKFSDWVALEVLPTIRKTGSLELFRSSLDSYIKSNILKATKC